MAKKNGGDFGDVDLDNLDDLNFDFSDFGDDKSKANSKSRDPIMAFAESAVSSVKDRMLDRDMLKRLVLQALPKGYSQASNAYDGMISGLGRIYKENQSDLAPYARNLKGKMDRSTGIWKSLIPRGLRDLIHESDQEEHDYSDNSSPEKDGLTANLEGLDRLFRLQVDGRREQTIKDAYNDQVGKKRFELEMASRVEMGQGINRLVNYQDTILIQYHRKSLEIGYRQLDISTRAAMAATKYYGKSLEHLDAISHNTGLPDWVKLNKEELLKQRLSSMLADTAMGGVAKWSRDYFKKVGDNASNMVSGFFSFKNQIDSAASLTDDGTGDGKGNRAYAAGQMLGSMAGSIAADFIETYLSGKAEDLKPWMEKIPGVKRVGQMLQNGLTGIPQRLNAYAQSETTREGHLGKLEEGFKALLDQYHPKTTISGQRIEDLDKPAIMDNLFYNSVTQVMPSYLASIDRWIRVMATGENQEEKSWNYYEGQLTSRSAVNEQHFKRLVLGGSGGQKFNVDRVLKSIGIDRLSDEAVKALRQALMRDMLKGMPFDPKRYIKPTFWAKLDEDTAEELINHIATQFGLNAEGEQTVKNDDITHRFTESNDLFHRVQQSLPDYTERMSLLSKVLGRRSWREMGLTKWGGGFDDYVDLDTLSDMLANEEGAKLADPARKRLSPQEALERVKAAKKKEAEERERREQGKDTHDDIIDPSRLRGFGGGGPSGPVNVTANVEWPELLNVADTKTHQRLDKLLEASQAAIEMLEIIAVNGGGGGGEGAPGEGGGDGGGKRPWFGRLSRGLGRGIGGTLGLLGKGMAWYTRKTYGALWGGVKGAFRGARWGVNALFKPRQGLGVSDIYVAGNPEPVMLARDIERGFYMDMKTKKTITSVKDIKGAVIDRDGNIVLTAEEFAQGLMAGDGSSLAGYAVDKAMDAVSLIGKGIAWYTKGTYGALGKVVKFGFDTLKDQFTQFDAYLPGDTEPRLRSNLMKQGFYRDDKGEPIFSLKDIKGAVFDIKGNEIISAEEIKQFGGAFYTRNGSLLFTIGRGMVSVGQFAMEQGWRAAKAYGRMVKSFYGKLWQGTKWAAGKLRSGIGKLLGFKGGHGTPGQGTGDGELDTAHFEVSIEQLKVQTSILDFLRKQFGDHRTAFDKDGDGVKENSWADILKRRKEGTSGKGKGATGGDAVVKAIDELGDRLDKNFEQLEETVEESGEESLTDRAADWLGGGKDGKRGGRRKPPGRIARWLGKSKIGRGALRVGGGLARGAGWLGRGALALTGLEGVAGVGGALLSGAGTAASLAGTGLGLAGAGLATVGGWLGAAATGLVSVLGAPVILGALALGGAAYLGYKYYKSSNAKKYPLLYLRMTQYGVAPTDENRVSKVLQLENMLYPQLKQSNDGTMSIDTNGLNVDKVIELFGTINDQKRTHLLLLWISQRFRPVFLAHCAAMKRIKGSFALESADDSISGTDMESYLNAVNLPNMEKIYNDEDTSPFDGDLTEDADDVTSAFEMVRKKAAAHENEVTTPKPVSPMMAARGLASTTDPSRVDNERVGVSQGGANDPQDVRKGLLLAATSTSGLAISHTAGAAYSNQASAINIPTAVRYKAYGLKEFILKRVEQLYKAEELVWPRIAYDGTRAASIGGSGEEMEKQLKAIFKPANEAEDLQVTLWIRYRFMPVILQYAISVRRRYNGPAQMAWRNMTGQAMKEVLTEVSETKAETPEGKRSVWEVRNSPWPGEVLETEPGTVQIYIDSLDTGDKGGPLTVQGLKQQDMASADNAKYQNRLQNIAAGATHGINSQISGRNNILKNYADLYKTGGVAGGLTGQSTTGYGTGQSVMRSGTGGDVVAHPGGGTDGDINSIPEPSGDGWKGVRDTIIAAAKMQGLDPKIAATVAGVESSYKIRASSGVANGLFQFIPGTWDMMMRKYGAKFGIAPGTGPFDARANAILGVRYLIDNYNILKSKLNIPVTDVALYASHFLGPGGAIKLLSADPGTPVNQVVGAQAIANNRNILATNGAMTTVGQVLANLDRTVGRGRGMHDLGSSAGTMAAPGPQGTPTTTNAMDFMGTGSEVTKSVDPTDNRADNTSLAGPGLGDGAQRAAAAATTAAGTGAGSPAASAPAPAAPVASSAPTDADNTDVPAPAPSAPAAPTPTQSVVQQQQQTIGSQQQEVMKNTEDLLQQQLEVLGSIDGSLKDILGQMAGLVQRPQQPQQANAGVPDLLKPRPPLARNPLNTQRSNPIT